MAMMKMMMKGLFVDVALTVNGRILKKRALRRRLARDADADRLRQAADRRNGPALLQSAKDIKSLAAVPSLKVVAEPNVTIELAAEGAVTIRVHSA
jgi:hypothetical protein